MKLDEIIKLLETNEYHNIQQAIGALEAMKPKTGQHEAIIYLDCGALGEQECIVSFDYIPEVRACSDHPGEHSYYIIHSLLIGGVDMAWAVDTKLVENMLEARRNVYED